MNRSRLRKISTIRQRRRALGINQTVLADLVGINQMDLSALERLDKFGLERLLRLIDEALARFEESDEQR